MTRRKLRFTATAREHVRLLKQWWKENSVRPEIFDHDLNEALKMLSLVPGIDTHDEREVVVRALWHARRGSGPDFGGR